MKLLVLLTLLPVLLKAEEIIRIGIIGLDTEHVIETFGEIYYEKVSGC